MWPDAGEALGGVVGRVAGGVAHPPSVLASTSWAVQPVYSDNCHEPHCISFTGSNIKCQSLRCHTVVQPMRVLSCVLTIMKNDNIAQS